MRLEMLLNIIIVLLLSSFTFQNDDEFKIECKVTNVYNVEKKAVINVYISGGEAPFDIYVYEKERAPWNNSSKPILQLDGQINREFAIELNNITDGTYYVMVKDVNRLIKIKKIEIKF